MSPARIPAVDGTSPHAEPALPTTAPQTQINLNGKIIASPYEPNAIESPETDNGSLQSLALIVVSAWASPTHASAMEPPAFSLSTLETSEKSSKQYRRDTLVSFTP